MTNETLDRPLHFNVITFYFHISHIIYVILYNCYYQYFKPPVLNAVQFDEVTWAIKQLMFEKIAQNVLIP